MQPVVVIEDLHKRFRTREREAGLRAAIRQLVRPQVREIHAVEGLSFTIQRGERVAFVGPNGAGKSTTIKVLSGILYPSSGRVEVMGLVPWRQRRELAYRIGTVFGQRTQLWYHLPAADTFELLASVYDRDPAAHRRRCARLVEAFEIGDLIRRPVRQLSLGERMRCEIAASLLHDPEILFLDEPTIGLDVTAKAIIRDLIREQSADGRTVLLTSHDTGDMERVCDRVIVIHEGRVLLDEPVLALRRGYIQRKLVTLHTAEERIDLDLPGVHVSARSPHTTELEVDVTKTPVEAVVQAALRASHLRDLRVEDPPMDEIVSAIYARAARAAP
jgi:ABC-2 type transport system ATP-binding protein